MELNTITIAAMILFTSVATYLDLKDRRIPNWLTVSAAVLGLTWNVFDSGFAGMVTSLGGFATGFGILLLLWLIGGGGGGDVKMMGAIGAWIGAMPTLIVFIASTVFAVLCTVVLLARSASAQKSMPVPNEGGESSTDDGSGTVVLQHSVPYALPVAMSVWALLLFHVIRA
ncbi:A24 family peptidase [Stieleria sp. JC731]|uniref:A24 family peptidase n=1 Tax=Pirellulaceae TaxID=2691357 RepID=UPI001E28DAEF|nr:A24 family peptidase [Stieleria sp. JC731]MCC9602745.1 A24 family peptidase [Stieleria sp. JC731]